MVIVALNGSPRADGRVSRIVDEILAGAADAGHETEHIRLSQLDVRDCTGCMQCQQEPPCVIRDDIARVEDAVRRADVLVLASPVHWGNMSAIMLRTMERLFGFLIEERPRGAPRARAGKGKRAVLVTACSTPWPLNWVFNQSRAVFGRFGEICRYSEIDVVGKYVLPGTIAMDDIPEKQLRKARRLGRSLR
jgi:multimeric flavodoxin WrbA